MKKYLLTMMLAVFALMATAQEMVLEGTYSSNQSYKVLLVITADGGEGVEQSAEKRCHYDLKSEIMGNHVVILAYNASLQGWVDNLYIISSNNKSFVVCPGLSTDNCTSVTFEQIEDASRIEEKKREYGLIGNGSGSLRRGKSSDTL